MGLGHLRAVTVLEARHCKLATIVRQNRMQTERKEPLALLQEVRGRGGILVFVDSQIR